MGRRTFGAGFLGLGADARAAARAASRSLFACALCMAATRDVALPTGASFCAIWLVVPQLLQHPRTRIGSNSKQSSEWTTHLFIFRGFGELDFARRSLGELEHPLFLAFEDRAVDVRNGKAGHLEAITALHKLYINKRVSAPLIPNRCCPPFGPKPSARRQGTGGGQGKGGMKEM